MATKKALYACVPLCVPTHTRNQKYNSLISMERDITHTSHNYSQTLLSEMSLRYGDVYNRNYSQFHADKLQTLAKRSAVESTCRQRRHQFYVSVRRYRRSVSYPVAVLIYRCINYSYRVDAGLTCIPARCSCSCNASAVGRFETADITETPLCRCGPPFKRHVPFACRLQLRRPFTAANFLYLL